jgi:hypothetical protein
LLAEEQPKPNHGILSFLRVSVREWLLEISFCHKKKLKISVQSSRAGTKEIANNLLAEAQRARRRGGTTNNLSHGDTEEHGDTEKHPRQKNQIPTAHGETPLF